MVAQHFQHWSSGGARWLAVIRHPRLAACHQCPTYMCRRAMLRAQAFQFMHGSLAVVDWQNQSDETAFAYLLFSGNGGGDRVGRHGKRAAAYAVAPRRSAISACNA